MTNTISIEKKWSQLKKHILGDERLSGTELMTTYREIFKVFDAKLSPALEKVMEKSAAAGRAKTPSGQTRSRNKLREAAINALKVLKDYKDAVLYITAAYNRKHPNAPGVFSYLTRVLDETSSDLLKTLAGTGGVGGTVDQFGN